jgi:hypothetical protein
MVNDCAFEVISIMFGWFEVPCNVRGTGNFFGTSDVSA